MKRILLAAFCLTSVMSGFAQFGETFNTVPKGWTLSSGANFGSIGTNGGIITPGVGGNNNETMGTPVVSKTSSIINFSLNVTRYTSNLNTLLTFPCNTYMDILFVNANVTSANDALLPANIYYNQSNILLPATGGNFATQFAFPAVVTASSFKVFISFHADCNQGGSKYFIDNMIISGISAPISTLPVKLISFAAKLENKKVSLNWATSMEKNAGHYVVQRSVNGKDFSDNAIVFAVGNSESRRDYSYTDNINTANSGLLYYRLKQVDIDGNFQYSDVRIIRLGAEKEQVTILTYPNPVINELRVTIPANWQDTKVVFEVFNGNGQVVRKITSNNASQTETIQVNDLHSGVYIIRASNGAESAMQKIVKK